MSSEPTDDFVEMRNGYRLPVPALVLGCTLERRGWTFKRVGDKLLVTRPKAPTTTSSGSNITEPQETRTETGQTGQIVEELTDEEKNGIRKWRDHLLVVVDMGTTTSFPDK